MVRNVGTGGAPGVLGLGADPSGPGDQRSDHPGPGEVPEKIDGDGWVEFRLDRFPLLPGTYDLTASLMDYNLAHPYDVRRNVLRMDVDRKGRSSRPAWCPWAGRGRSARRSAGFVGVKSRGPAAASRADRLEFDYCDDNRNRCYEDGDEPPAQDSELAVEINAQCRHILAHCGGNG